MTTFEILCQNSNLFFCASFKSNQWIVLCVLLTSQPLRSHSRLPSYKRKPENCMTDSQMRKRMFSFCNSCRNESFEYGLVLPRSPNMTDVICPSEKNSFIDLQMYIQRNSCWVTLNLPQIFLCVCSDRDNTRTQFCPRRSSDNFSSLQRSSLQLGRENHWHGASTLPNESRSISISKGWCVT